MVRLTACAGTDASDGKQPSLTCCCRHSNVSAYLGWCEQRFATPGAIPVLRIDGIEDESLCAWLKSQRPDVVVMVHVSEMVREFSGFLRRRSLRVPRDFGVIAITQALAGTPFSGLEENQQSMGARAAELLIARILNRDFGIPAHPRTEMVESRWIEGRSLRGRTG